MGEGVCQGGWADLSVLPTSEKHSQEANLGQKGTFKLPFRRLPHPWDREDSVGGRGGKAASREAAPWQPRAQLQVRDELSIWGHLRTTHASPPQRGFCFKGKLYSHFPFSPHPFPYSPPPTMAFLLFSFFIATPPPNSLLQFLRGKL